ncbi:MAG: tRNA 2-thiouridine(34) synthase MnmA [Clostridia bacterium]|nr:tRNA 2-thiouridine(34) synthase MnmA [Clostridia bacterium]
MKVLVAMSGGVDSAVSAYLVKQNHEAIGVTMKLHDESDNLIYGENSCCSMQDIRDAKSVCDILGIPHETHDFGAQFKECVIADFINCYKNGSTPNPCVVCNRKIKFEQLLKMAMERGYDAIATGHYARIEKSENGRYLLKKALDLSKDQSYVLYSLTQHQLAHTIFPLGEMTKADARNLAEQIGFVNARKKDSQDVCFIPDGDYVSFIEQTTGETFEKGNFIDVQGNILGTHQGIIKYTIGQRKGLGLALGEPMYVIEKNLENNTVTLARNSELFGTTLTASNINLISCEKIEKPLKIKAKIRYNQKEQPATVEQIDDDTIRVIFDEPQRAITRGQSVVLYDEDIVVGGGIIN